MKQLGKKATICWYCANAHGLGCDWFRRHEPVQGWDAVRHDVNGSPKSIHRTIESYYVRNCPEFVAGKVGKLG